MLKWKWPQTEIRELYPQNKKKREPQNKNNNNKEELFKLGALKFSERTP